MFALARICYNCNMSNENNNRMRKVQAGGIGGIWFLGFVGTLIYFLHYHSGTFWLVVIAIFKALFWPAFLVYYLLRFMHL